MEVTPWPFEVNSPLADETTARGHNRCLLAEILDKEVVVDPLSKRIVFSWIATDIIWATLFIWVQKREQG